MEYMEQQMQQSMMAGEHRADEIFAQMDRFEDFYLSISDTDETLIDAKVGYFDYANEDVQLMWVCFRRGAGV